MKLVITAVSSEVQGMGHHPRVPYSPRRKAVGHSVSASVSLLTPHFLFLFFCIRLFFCPKDRIDMIPICCFERVAVSHSSSLSGGLRCRTQSSTPNSPFPSRFRFFLALPSCPSHRFSRHPLHLGTGLPRQSSAASCLTHGVRIPRDGGASTRSPPAPPHAGSAW